VEEKLAELKARLAEIYDLRAASAVLSWDQQTYMPPGGAGARAEILATLSRLAHEKFTSTETGRLLDELKTTLDSADPDGDDVRLIQAAARDYEREHKLPAELVAEFARAAALAHEAWVKARSEKNFQAFLPALEKIFTLSRRAADYYGFADSPYDALLDGYEPGAKTADVRRIFAELRDGLVPLVKAIAARPETDDSVLRQRYAEQKQWQFAEEVIKKLGYDFDRGRQDKAPHPFCATFGLGDVRLTARVDENFLPTHLMSAIHEAGHGMYEQGLTPSLARSPLFDAPSLGLHESQSRLWENLVGRSRGFWKYYYPRLQSVFPENLGGVDFGVFYQAINKVKPSLIRVEADEVTYSLHIMIRFEIEVDVLEGRLAVQDIPGAWNAKYKDYLGLDVPDDSLGCLQDVHWSMGYVGYFSTYTLGNLASVQIFEKALADEPAIPADIERGEFASLLGWLRMNIHQHGRKYQPGELLQRVTGRPLDSAPYLAYLQRKYSEIYGL